MGPVWLIKGRGTAVGRGALAGRSHAGLASGRRHGALPLLSNGRASRQGRRASWRHVARDKDDDGSSVHSNESEAAPLAYNMQPSS